MKYIVLIFLIFSNCNHSQEKEQIQFKEQTQSKDMSVEAEYKFKVIKYGSEDALKKLETLFTSRGNMYCELLPYAKYLADFYNSGYGCEKTADALIATSLFKYLDNEPQMA